MNFHFLIYISTKGKNHTNDGIKIIQDIWYIGNMGKKFAASMFAGGGISELGFEKNNVQFIASNEILKDRATLLQLNHPSTKIFVDDAWDCFKDFISFCTSQLKEKNLFLFLATPPCQGMSSNGVGTLLNNARKGLRPKLDPRNRLIIPALIVAKKLRPEWIVFENVSGMKNTIIENDDGKLVNILDLIKQYLGNNYVGEAKVVDFADYGLPQRRKRLITIYTQNKNAKQHFQNGVSLIPPATHDRDGNHGLAKWITLKDALKGFSTLDAVDEKKSKSRIDPLHHVPVMDPKKYHWIKHTPHNSTAFDNQCINPKCRYTENEKHGVQRNKLGINPSLKTTPLYCIKCGSLLPRPYVEKDGTLKIMSGYVSAYKRMSWHLPASTITTNFLYACSDNKIHPEENRTLSIAESSKLQSISDYGYQWGPIKLGTKSSKIAHDTLIRNIIGESAPPMFFDKLYNWLIFLESNTVKKKRIPTYLQTNLH